VCKDTSWAGSSFIDGILEALRSINSHLLPYNKHFKNDKPSFGEWSYKGVEKEIYGTCP
jgi:hypothetical protein